jgi:hypothetical protein
MVMCTQLFQECALGGIKRAYMFDSDNPVDADSFLTHRPPLAATPVVSTKVRRRVALWNRGSFSFLLFLTGVSTLRRFFDFAHSVATGLRL